jgi:cobalamin biosynthesis protein CobT
MPDNIRPMTPKDTTAPMLTDKGTYTPIGNLRFEEPGGSPNVRVRSRITDLATASGLSRQMQRYFKAMSKDTYSYGLHRGKVHGKNLSRLYSGADNPRIFKRRDQHVLKTDSAVTIMMDCSSSMDGDKYEISSACCAIISEALTELRIPHEILGFTDRRGHICIYPFKWFHKRFSKSSLIDRFSSHLVQKVYTPDGESIVIGASRLLERKERNKMMLVLSDGEPYGTYGGSGEWYLKKVCQMVEASGIHLIGLGIQDSNVESYYTNHAVIYDIEEDLEPMMIEALKKTLI